MSYTPREHLKRQSVILEGISQDLKYKEIASQLGVNRWVILNDLKIMRKNRDPRLEQAKKTMDLMTKAFDSGYVSSCHDLSEGGLAVASAEMAFSSGYGLELNLKTVPRSKEKLRNDSVLFSESNSRFLVEVTEKRKENFEALMKDAACAEIGRVQKDDYLSVNGLNDEEAIHADLQELRKRWKGALGG